MSQIIQKRVEAALNTPFPGEGPVHRDVLAEAELPSGLRHFLLRSLERRVHLVAEGFLVQEHDWVDIDRIKTSDLVFRLSDHLQIAGQFPREEWKKAVSTAVEAQLSYLQEPARALADFAFQPDSTTLPASDLQRRTGYFSDYPYMSKAVDAWLEKRDQQGIDRNAFESAMRHLDCRLTADYDAEQWLRLLQPLVDIMQFAGVQPAGLPVGMAIRFFEAKDRPAIASLIRSAAQLHRAEMITLPSLRDIIQRAFENERIQEQGSSLRAVAPAAPETPDEDKGVDSAQTPPGEPQVPGAANNEPLPLWKRFQQRVDGPTETSTSKGPGESSPQPLWKSFEKPGSQGIGARTASGQEREGNPPVRSETEPVPVSHAPRLEAQHIVLGTAVRSRDRFIRDLFDGNEDIFTDVMEELAEAPGWTEASSIIADRVFRPYRIDIYSDVAVDFTNAVEARYSGLAS